MEGKAVKLSFGLLRKFLASRQESVSKSATSHKCKALSDSAVAGRLHLSGLVRRTALNP